MSEEVLCCAQCGQILGTHKWHDASEVLPLPCRRCVVEWQVCGDASGYTYYDVYHYDSIQRTWIGSNGHRVEYGFMALRWQHLDTGGSA